MSIHEGWVASALATAGFFEVPLVLVCAVCALALPISVVFLEQVGDKADTISKGLEGLD